MYKYFRCRYICEHIMFSWFSTWWHVILSSILDVMGVRNIENLWYLLLKSCCSQYFFCITYGARRMFVNFSSLACYICFTKTIPIFKILHNRAYFLFAMCHWAGSNHDLFVLENLLLFFRGYSCIIFLICYPMVGNIPYFWKDVTSL